MASDNSHGESRSGNRWWESYLPRYLSGFIVGTLCVVILVANAVPVDKAAKLLGPAVALVLHDQKFEPTKTLAVKSIAEPSSGAQASPTITYEVQDSGGATIALAILGLGVAFCYLSSAPITVLHAGRMYNTWADRQARGMWLGWSLALLAAPAIWHATTKLTSLPWLTTQMEWVAIVVILGLNMLVDPLSRQAHQNKLKFKLAFPSMPLWRDPPTDADKSDGDPRCKSKRKRESRAERDLHTTGFALIVQVALWAAGLLILTDIVRRSCWMAPMWFMLAVPAMWIGFTQYNTLANLFLNQSRYADFTFNLALARQNPKVYELRETYTHLREHSNAVFIVVVELSLLALSLGLLQPHSGDPMRIEGARSTGLPLWSAMALTVVWLVPTIFMWARANFLERQFQEDSLFDEDEPGVPAPCPCAGSCSCADTDPPIQGGGNKPARGGAAIGGETGQEPAATSMKGELVPPKVPGEEATQPRGT